MIQYIDKSVLVAEIEKRKRRNVLNEGAFEEDIDILSFINTLEVKEVDLDAELEHYKEEQNIRYEEDINMFEFAKHFFELGLRVNGYHQAEKDNELTWEDMRELYIIFADVDVGIELCKTDIQAETIGYYQEVLKRFKAYKGEEV